MAERFVATTLVRGEPTEVTMANRPARFYIELASGTYLEGMIPANSGLTVCSQGDVVKFEVTIDKDSTAGLSVVQPDGEAG